MRRATTRERRAAENRIGTCFVLAAVLLGCSALELRVHSADIHVDDDNTTGTTTGTALYPYPSIQRAIDEAQSGDRILVAEGTYPENVVVRNKAVHLLGRYRGGDAAAYASGTGGDFEQRDPAAPQPILQGAQQRSSAVIILSRDETGDVSGTVVDGFEIRGGERGISMNAWPPVANITISSNLIVNNGPPLPPEDSEDYWRDRIGGGILVVGTDNMVIQSNIIRSNWSGLGGGIGSLGVENDENEQLAKLEVLGNRIEDNIGYHDHGGGVYLSGQVNFSGNEVSDNRIGEGAHLTWGYGGGVYFREGSQAVLTGNRTHHNYAPSSGGGVFIDNGAHAVLRNELIYANTVSTNGYGGAGIYVDQDWQGWPSCATLSHCTVANNTGGGEQAGNGVYVENSAVAVINSIFWGNGDDFYVPSTNYILTVTYSISEEVWPGTGNLSADPLFADAEHGDFHVKSQAGRWNVASGVWEDDSVHSPAIDAAAPDALFDLEPQPNGGRANLGAYGNTAEASRGRPSIHASGFVQAGSQTVFEVTVLTRHGETFVLEATEDLASSTWNAVVEVTGDGTVRALHDPDPPAQACFYRVRQR